MQNVPRVSAPAEQSLQRGDIVIAEALRPLVPCGVMHRSELARLDKSQIQGLSQDRSYGIAYRLARSSAQQVCTWPFNTHLPKGEAHEGNAPRNAHI
jgi:hypothetical protein